MSKANGKSDGKVVAIDSKVELTELERLKLENFALKHNVMSSQLQQIVSERTAYLRQLEAAHPGSVWDEQRGLIPVVLPESVETGSEKTQ